MQKKMLFSKCLCGLTCQLEVANTPKPLTFTIFPETLSRFFDEAVIQPYKDSISILETKILTMDNVDFQYNTKKITTNITEHDSH